MFGSAWPISFSGPPICETGVPAQNSACRLALSWLIRPLIFATDTMVPSVGTSGLKECPEPTGRMTLPALPRINAASSSSFAGAGRSAGMQLWPPDQLRQTTMRSRSAARSRPGRPPNAPSAPATPNVLISSRRVNCIGILRVGLLCLRVSARDRSVLQRRARHEFDERAVLFLIALHAGAQRRHALVAAECVFDQNVRTLGDARRPRPRVARPRRTGSRHGMAVLAAAVINRLQFGRQYGRCRRRGGGWRAGGPMIAASAQASCSAERAREKDDSQKWVHGWFI